MPSRNRRLPRHRSWPLTATDISEALDDQMAHVSDVSFLTGHSEEGYVLGIEWTAAQPFNYGRGIHPDASGFRIDVLPVPAADRADARTALRTYALPQLGEWINQALAAPETWRSSDHRRYWRLADGLLTHHDQH
nr:hypothetical protein [Streptomyces capitiformicae]